MPHLIHLLLTLLMMSLLNACDQNSGHAEDAKLGTVTIQAWAHAGQAAERQVLTHQVEQFNQQTDNIEIKLTFIPERDYNAQVQAAALAGDLPDILEFDGPYLYNYIWQQHLLPLESLLPATLIDDLLPTIVLQGTYGRHLYSVGVFDSGLGLYARKSALSRINVRIPQTAADAWRIEEFNQILDKLAQHDDDGAVLDLKLNYSGEWFTYGFSPVLQSAGADLINRDSYQNSNGILNSKPGIVALTHVQDWIQNGRVDPNLDDAAFVAGRVALSWVGHWEYSRYRQAWQDDLVIVPLPDFGQGSKTGQGSWNWGITTNCQRPEAAAEFLRFLLQPDQVLAMSDVNGAVPGTRSAVARSVTYGEDGELQLFTDQIMQGVAVPRPRTPAYPIITTAFQQAFQQIRNGANVKQSLDTAAKTIDRDIRDNQGYPFLTE
ncbi:MAG: sugar ABC transporter substrate-binding protein [Gammaproteobacteria bacterium]|jgi:multiple sugar transport system substrate-binding protein